MVEMVEMTPQDSPLISKSFGKYIVSEEIEALEGFDLPEIIERYLPKVNDWKRSIGSPDINKGVNFIEDLESIRYMVTTSINGKPYQIAYLVGYDLKLFLSLVVILLVFQLIILIVEFSKGTKLLGKLLNPYMILLKQRKSASRSFILRNKNG